MKRQSMGAVCALAAAGGVLWAGYASAEVVGGAATSTLGGTFEELDPPPTTAGPDAFQSPNLVAFDEEQDLLLTTTVALTPNLSLPAGSVLSSHYVAFDPPQGAMVDGFVEFDEPIVAVIGGPAALDASAALFGLDAVAYSTSPAIGPEGPNPDMVFVSPVDPNRLVFAAGANSPGDQVRVLTGLLVPEPAGVWLVFAAVAGAVWRRRR